MKTINELKDGDTVWIRRTYVSTSRTKEVGTAKVRHVLQDEDDVSKMTGFRHSWIRLIEFDGAPRIHYRPEDGDKPFYSSAGMFNSGFIIYTEKSLLISALQSEKKRLVEEVDAFISQI